VVYLLVIPIIFVYTLIVWVAVLFLYNTLVEPFDFGPLGTFAAKSLGLVFAVSLFVTFVPFGMLASLIVWWLGLTLVFKKDFWECKVLVILIWGANFVIGLGIQAIMQSFQRSPISTV
jgi:hypothetical protein